jgi:hypothetical protein
MLFTNQIQYFQIITMAYFGVSGAVGKNKISYNGWVYEKVYLDKLSNHHKRCSKLSYTPC